MSTFETEVCGRCGGTGHYSYNQIDGTRCYGCMGAGRRLTKRGEIAQQKFIDMGKKPLSEINIGDVIFIDGFPGQRGYWSRVVEIGERKKIGESMNPTKRDEWIPYFGREVKTMHPKKGQGGVIADDAHLLRVQRSPEVIEAHKAECLALQESLTKAGTIRKRKSA